MIGQGRFIDTNLVGITDKRWSFLLPGVPTGVTASLNNQKSIVSWTAPAAIPQAPVTDYFIQYSSDSGSTWTTFSDGVSTSTSATVTGLTNGMAYVFRVAAVNVIGIGAYSSASQPVTPVTGDQYFNNVSLLLHMDGINGGTTFSDVSGNAFAVTSTGNVTTTTSTSVFGGASAAFAGGYLTIGSSSAFGLGTGDFTIECWVRPTVGTGLQGLINVGRYDSGLLWRVGGATDSLYLNSSASNWNQSTNAPLNTWTHVALVRSGSSVVVYSGGASVHTRTSSADLNSANAVVIGTGAHNLSETFSGYIDELRITKGVARYTSNFTPPSAAFFGFA
jgi:Concanavalin A-like lectin/glucanases superfamily/Fibronectin type III domain